MTNVRLRRAKLQGCNVGDSPNKGREIVFLPDTLGAWAAVAASIASTGAVVVSVLNRKNIARVQVQVNGNVARLRDDVDKLTTDLGEVTYQRNKLAGDAAYARGVKEARDGNVTGPRGPRQ